MIKQLCLKYFPGLWVIPGLLIMLGLSACSSVSEVVATPKISVQNIALQNISLQQGTALIRLNVSNPSGFPLPLRGVRYGLRLNGRQVAHGRHAQQRNIKAHETVTMDIPVQMNLSAIVNLIPAILRDRQVQYDLQGVVDLPYIGIPFSRRGGAGV